MFIISGIIIYDVLFSDVRDLQTTTLRFNDKNLKDLTGKEYRWREYYDKKGLLYLRKEYQFFDSKNVLLIETDGKKDIKKITVWKDTEKVCHCFLNEVTVTFLEKGSWMGSLL